MELGGHHVRAANAVPPDQLQGLGRHRSRPVSFWGVATGRQRAMERRRSCRPPTPSRRAVRHRGLASRGAKRSSTMSTPAPEWSMICSSSRAVRWVLSGMSRNPASWHANDAWINRAPLSARTATPSPVSDPTERNRWTNWCASPASSAYVGGPSGLSMIAIASGRSSAIHQIPVGRPTGSPSS